MVFPLLALAGRPLLAPVLGETLYLGLVFLAAAPSTVQSSIAFTSIAGGNVAGAAQRLAVQHRRAGDDPPLVGLFVTSEAGGLSLHSMRAIALQLLVPFVGKLARRWIGATR